MEGKELVQYLKDAIDQETSIVEQEKLIEQMTADQQRRKPQLTKKDNHKVRPQLKQESYGTPQFSWSIGIGIASLVIGLCVFLFTSYYAGYYAGFSSMKEEMEQMIAARGVSLLICLFGVLCFIPAALIAISTKRQNEAHLAAYSKELLAYDKHIEELKAENRQLQEQHQKKASAWKSSFRQLKSHMTAPLTESQALLEKFYASDVIYPKYRTLPALTSIYEYFMTGRCTELTGPHGAYNLYEDELRKDTVISQLNTVIENLEQIRHNQYMLYQQVKAIQENTAVIASELNQIKGYTVQIAQLTALNAYYAALNERNTRITMYYHL